MGLLVRCAEWHPRSGALLLFPLQFRACFRRLRLDWRTERAEAPPLQVFGRRGGRSVAVGGVGGDL